MIYMTYYMIHFDTTATCTFRLIEDLYTYELTDENVQK